jgi:hypothetical protein
MGIASGYCNVVSPIPGVEEASGADKVDTTSRMP